MAVTVTDPKSAGYTPNGSTTAFGFDFKIASADEIRVVQVINGVEVELDPDTYSVTLAVDGEGGTVTFNTAPTSGGGKIYLISDPDFTQTAEFDADGPFTPRALNDIHDRGVIRDLVLRHRIEDVEDGLEEEAETRAAADTALSDRISAMNGVVVDAGELVRFTPEQYGAAGDGVTNDTTAFQLLSAAVMAAGGGVIDMRPGAVYLVGRQSLTNDGDFMWRGELVCEIYGCTRPVIINGNGAKFKIAPGKYGTFDAAGAPTANALPYWGGEASTMVYRAVITLRDNSGDVSISDIEVDGNEQNMTWGGQYGDDGYQISPDAFWLYRNSGQVFTKNLKAYRLPRDAMQLLDDPETTLSTPGSHGVHMGHKFEYNVRQGLSVIGAKGHTFIGCKFNFTGKGSHRSSPASGVDLESENGIIRDITFIDCEFMANDGVGFLVANAPVSNIRFKGCKFVGTTTDALWAYAPYMAFEDCTFGGRVLSVPSALVAAGHPYAALNKYKRCIFTDDTDISPTGALYLSVLSGLGNNMDGTIFEECHFRAGHTKPIGTLGGYFRDCSFNFGNAQAISVQAPRLSGLTRITSTAAAINFLNPLDVQFSGPIELNGTKMRSGFATYDPPSLAAGASATTTVNVPWAQYGDIVRVGPIVNTQGIRVWGYVSNPGTEAGGGVVTVVYENRTAGTIDLASHTVHVSVVSRDLHG